MTKTQTTKSRRQAVADPQASTARTNMPESQSKRLISLFHELRLREFRDHFTGLAQQSIQESWSHTQYLLELTELEAEARRQSRISRLMLASRLPRSKTWENFQWQRLPATVTQQMESLRDGSFLDRRENLLIFGNPGSGKTHCVSALGEQLIQQGRSILFTTCSLLVQQLLLAKRELRLPKEIRKLLSYDGLIIDDLGYVQQTREEMEVVFTLLAERYERGSVLLTSNLPFSKWEQIFKDSMTTAAAIDRLVHHSVILELNVPSYRLEKARKSKPGTAEDQKTHATKET